MITSITGLYLELHWNDSNDGTAFAEAFAAYLFESGQGILYWLVAFEFYTSALTMEGIIMNNLQ